MKDIAYVVHSQCKHDTVSVYKTLLMFTVNANKIQCQYIKGCTWQDNLSFGASPYSYTVLGLIIYESRQLASMKLGNASFVPSLPATPPPGMHRASYSSLYPYYSLVPVSSPDSITY